MAARRFIYRETRLTFVVVVIINNYRKSSPLWSQVSLPMRGPTEPLSFWRTQGPTRPLGPSNVEPCCLFGPVNYPTWTWLRVSPRPGDACMLSWNWCFSLGLGANRALQSRCVLTEATHFAEPAWRARAPEFIQRCL